MWCKSTSGPFSSGIDAWGFLTTRTNRAILTDAYFEVNGHPRADDPLIPPAKPDTTNDQVLTDIRQIRSLPKERANENLRVRIRGVLTCVDLEWRVVFLQNGHDAIFLDTGQSGLEAGQWVEVTAQTDGKGFAPQLINCATRILGTTNMPSVAKVDLQDATTGQLDSQWVEMEGVVRRRQQRKQPGLPDAGGFDHWQIHRHRSRLQFAAGLAEPIDSFIASARLRLHGQQPWSDQWHYASRSQPPGH